MNITELLTAATQDTDACIVVREGYPYPSMTLNYKTIKLHKFVYEKLKGKLSKGIVPDHTCKNKECINIRHLEAVTHKENTIRGNGPTAINAQKTHCIHGHEFTPENTIRVKLGRQCRICYNNRRNGKRVIRGQNNQR